MLDLQWIRQNSSAVQDAADKKGIVLDVEELLRWDRTRRQLLQSTEEARAARNRLSREIAAVVQGAQQLTDKRAEAKADETVAGSAAEQAAEQLRQLKLQSAADNQRLSGLETELRQAKEKLDELLLLVPNITSSDTPDGRSDADNVEMRRVGQPLDAVDYPLKDHMELGQLHGLIDVPRGVQTAGTRSYYLTGNGALLHRAVQQLAVDLLVARGFTLMEVPLMVRPDALTNTGFFPLGQDQVYPVEQQQYLTGTSEVSLVSYYSGEVLDLTTPVKLGAASACFRKEVGSAGRDVHGLYRVHQFSKVEQVVLCEADPDLSEQLLQEITANAEELLQLLELPYRVVAVCAGDMSQKNHKQYDIETWMPGRGAYGETHSASNVLDFQARRANIRYRSNLDGKLRYCHTLNNTMVASPRILIPLLENHQQEDGSVTIPQALQKYMHGLQRLQI